MIKNHRASQKSAKPLNSNKEVEMLPAVRGSVNGGGGGGVGRNFGGIKMTAIIHK
jgi:hypothetical protein